MNSYKAHNKTLVHHIPHQSAICRRI